MNGKLEGKIALVSGGSSGIGLATARRFIKEGAFVFITGRRHAELEEASAMLGEQAQAIRADASNLADLDHLFDHIRKQKGRLDVLFANAGGGNFAALGSITEEHFDQIFNTNVKGLVFTVQKALPLMSEGGTIILNASIVSMKAVPGFSVYSATKAAVRSFARGWTLDLKDRKIRVNAISPGPIRTPGLDGLTQTEEERHAFYGQMASTVPLGRVGDADEIAKAAVFLASEDSSFVAGIELFVDGGAAQV